MGAERDRVAGFGRMEDGLRQSGDWYRWGPYVSRRPCFGGTSLMQDDPAWHDNLIFSEYGEVDAIGDVIRRITAQAPETARPEAER